MVSTHFEVRYFRDGKCYGIGHLRPVPGRCFSCGLPQPRLARSRDEQVGRARAGLLDGGPTTVERTASQGSRRWRPMVSCIVISSR